MSSTIGEVRAWENVEFVPSCRRDKRAARRRVSRKSDGRFYRIEFNFLIATGTRASLILPSGLINKIRRVSMISYLRRADVLALGQARAMADRPSSETKSASFGNEKRLGKSKFLCVHPLISSL